MRDAAAAVIATALVVIAAALAVIAVTSLQSSNAAEESACWAEVTARIQADSVLSNRLNTLMLDTDLPLELEGYVESIYDWQAVANGWIERCLGGK